MARNQFDEIAFEDYLRAVEAFSVRTPYLALNQIINDSEFSIDKVYVPAFLKIVGGNEPDAVSKNETGSMVVISEQSNNLNIDEKSKADGDESKSIYSVAEVVKKSRTKSKERHILLQGTAGAGKTTALQRIARDAWANPAKIGLKRKYLSAIVRLRVLAGITEISFDEELWQSLRLGGDIKVPKKLPENFFSGWSREKDAPWLIMLDGLDEAAADDRAELMQWINELVGRFKDEPHLIVLTSRPSSEPQFQNLTNKFLMCEMLAFDREQQGEFAARWFGNRAADFLAKVERLSQPSGVFREKLTMTPLLLTIAAIVFQSEGDLPESGQNELYESFIGILFDEAKARGFKQELGDELFSVAQSALERLALEMTDNPERNSFKDLSKVCAEFVAEELNYTPAQARSAGKKLCEALTRRSGVLHREADVCLWGHATLREYLAARALIYQLEDGKHDYQTALGERILDSKNYEMLLAFSRRYDGNRSALIRWMCEWTREKLSASAANLVYDVWDESEKEIKRDLQKNIVLALGSSFADRQIGLNLRRGIRRVLIEMGAASVEPLVELLVEYNALQSRLVPEWINLEERPDVDSEIEEKLHASYDIRTNIIKILGEIGDKRAVEPLIELLSRNSQSDKHGYHIAESARKALSCIGQPVLVPLLTKIKNKSLPVEWRCAYIRGLISVGIRTTEVSETLSKILHEGLDENEKLLADAITVASVLRDKTQVKLIENSLESNNLEVVARAASYFSLIPNQSAAASLEKAFKKYHTKVNEKNYKLRDAVERLSGALLKNGDAKSQRFVFEFLKNNLRGNGLFYRHEALRLLKHSNLQIIPQLFVRELAEQLTSSEPDVIAADLLSEIAGMWQPKELSKLKTNAADELQKVPNKKKNFVAKLIDIGNETAHSAENQPLLLSERIKENDIVKALANCQIENFGHTVGTLLSKQHFSRSIGLCRSLWIASDPDAEPFLLRKLRQLIKKRKPEQESSTEEYYVIRALSTCGTEKGAKAVIDFIRKNPNLSIYLPDEVLRPLVRRKMISAEAIRRMALDRNGTHQFVRNFCLQTLGGINVPEFLDVFLDALANETHEETKGFAAHALGFAKAKKKKQVIKTLEDVILNTDSKYIASEAGQALVRLKSRKSLNIIENAISRFGGGEKMSKLLRAAASFRAVSTFEFLRDIQDNTDTSPHTDRDIIVAFGEFYETEKRAREIIHNRFEKSYNDYDSGRQQSAVGILVRRNPNYLLQSAAKMYDSETLEQSAKLQIIEYARSFGRHKSLDQNAFAELYKRFLCDSNLEVRERAGASLNFVREKLRQGIYDYLKTFKGEWVRGCLIYSLGFWNSDLKEIERFRFDRSKLIRHFANTALPIREKRNELKKTLSVFQTTRNSAERVAAYLALTNQAENSHVDELYRLIKYDQPMHIFLRSLEEKVERRIKDERQKREKSEKEIFCRVHQQS